MYLFRNGSLQANALLIAIGAAAGVGVTVLVKPLTAIDRRNVNGLARNEPSSHNQSLNRNTGGSAQQGKAPSTISNAIQLTDPQERALALHTAGADAARQDPAAALLLAAGLNSEQDKLEYLRGIYSVWGSTDPTAALEYAKSNMAAGLARSETIGIAVNKWASKDPRAAWLWSQENLSGPLKEQALTDVLIGWTRKTPAAAAQWMASTGLTSQPLISVLAKTWAEQNPKAALDWSKTLATKEAIQSAQTAVASEWAAQNPPQAAESLTPAVSLPDGANLATAITEIWGTTDPKATSDWFNSLPSGPGKDEAAATLATVWAASDIQGAIAWSATLADPNIQRQVITHIGTTWGAIEPDSALEWLTSLPGPIASEGIIGAFNSWAATDPIGLREAVDANPTLPEMDQARLALADVLASSDISSSMTLASQISSSTGRDDATARYFRQWRKIDDTSAQEWLAQNWNSLTPSVQQRLTLEQRRNIVVR
ncbi:MAG: hypothetical protein ABI600_19830 [Luteolibacter sp.]